MVDKHESLTDSSTPDKADRNTDPQPPAGGYYEICVQGHLNHKWSDWLEGMEVRLLEDGQTVLCGTIVDQAALMGLLNRLHGLNLTLLSVNQRGPQI
jgi:hypothetical protein